MIRQAEDTQLHDLVRDTIARWRDGEQPDAAALLTRHPALSRHKSLAIDLIYEEYCLRSEAGDTLLHSTFCDRFPGYHHSLVKMLEVHEALERDATRRPAPVWPQVGESFHGYDLIDSLGRGSLARVFLAREAALGNRLVVVKISQDGAREAHLLGKVAHPAIVPVYSVKHDEETGWTCICMPLVGTATVTDLLDAAFADGGPPADARVMAQVAGQFRPVGVPSEAPSADRRLWKGSYVDEVARLGLTLAEGMQAAHDAGIVHRDIKPSNVLLSWSGRPMLLDFNLSTDVSLVNRRVGGTLPYMAPELMRGMSAANSESARQFDPRSDVFSLGAVLYHLLTGELPAQPANADVLPADAIEPWLACRARRVPSLRERNPDVQPELEAVVLRCLASDPHERYSSASALAEALRRYLSPGARGKRLVRRHRRAVICTAALLAAAGLASAIYSATLPPYEERLFERALREYDRAEYAAAAKTLAECLELHPDWPEARFARGQTLRQRADFAGAIADFRELRPAYPAIAGAMVGFCHLEKDDAHAATSEYALACQMGDRSAVTLTNYAHCLRTRNELQTAIDSLNQAIETDPTLAAAYYQRASCFLNQWHQSKTMAPGAIKDARRACEIAPEAPHHHILAASIYATMEIDEAIDAAIRDHLQQAYEHGHPPEMIGYDELLRDWASVAPGDPTLRTPLAKLGRKHAVPSLSLRLGDFIR